MKSITVWLLLTKKIKQQRNYLLSPMQKKLKRRQLIKAIMYYRMIKRREKVNIQRQFWVHPIFTEQRRNAQGASRNLITEMESADPNKYIEFLRMSPSQFQELLELIQPRIEKRHVIRTPISATTRLQICLRYLASGDTMPSISFVFRVGLKTVSKIIAETCQAIWDALVDRVFPEITKEMWLKKAVEFETMWNFPHCIRSIDGRHMEIVAPPRSGSTYFNYKGRHSIVLLAVADANCCFTAVDIGGEGRRSDGGIFLESDIGQHLLSNSLNLPYSRPIEEGGDNIPFVLVGDEAFALTSFMMRPYPKANNLNLCKKVFNYRLSRARRTVECAFGILTARWRIFKRPMSVKKRTAKKIIQATVCLHNFLMQNDLVNSEENRYYSTYTPPHDTTINHNILLRNRPDEENDSTEEADEIQDERNNTATSIRDEFTNYFCNTGAMDHQWEKALRNDF